MPNMQTTAIDWASVNWSYVAMLTGVVFVTTLIGALLSFKRPLSAAMLSAFLFAAAFVYLTYYPHGHQLPALDRTTPATK